MESRVLKVRLGVEVILDIETLAKYSGKGVWREVELESFTADRYEEELKRTWAWNTKWRVTRDGIRILVINKPYYTHRRKRLRLE